MPESILELVLYAFIAEYCPESEAFCDELSSLPHQPLKSEYGYLFHVLRLHIHQNSVYILHDDPSLRDLNLLFQVTLVVKVLLTKLFDYRLLIVLQVRLQLPPEISLLTHVFRSLVFRLLSFVFLNHSLIEV